MNRNNQKLLKRCAMGCGSRRSTDKVDKKNKHNSASIPRSPRIKGAKLIVGSDAMTVIIDSSEVKGLTEGEIASQHHDGVFSQINVSRHGVSRHCEPVVKRLWWSSKCLVTSTYLALFAPDIQGLSHVIIVFFHNKIIVAIVAVVASDSKEHVHSLISIIPTLQ